MRRAARFLGTLLVVGGLATLGWVATVWLWKDPFTTLYTHWQQDRLEASYEQRGAGFDVDLNTVFAARKGTQEVALSAQQRVRLASVARRYRKSLHPGDAVGRLDVPALGMDMMLVEGTDHDSLKKGPGHYRGSFLPGEGKLIYVAGHRTTYGAPFGRIDRLEKGDRVVVEMPYGRFVYRVTRHVVVRADQVEVLKSRGREELALQACHPRFFASHRYIAYAVPVSVEVGNAVYRVERTRVAAGA